MHEIVPDTNVLVSGFLVSQGNPAFIIDAWRNGRIQIVTSFEIIAEFQRVMLENLNAIKEDVEIFTGFLIWKGKIVEPKQKFDAVKDDPSDNKFLEAAVEGGANYIVSGDKHLKNLGEFNGIKIISPAEMAAILKENTDTMHMSEDALKKDWDNKYNERWDKY